MKRAIVSACLSTMMDEVSAKRLALVQNFTEMQLAAFISGIATKIISIDKELLLKKLSNESAKEIKEVILSVELQRVEVRYSVRRYAEEPNEVNYYKTNSRKDDRFCNEVYPVTYTNFDVDELADLVEFEFV